MRKLTTKQFIEKAQQVHGDVYGYELVEYVTNITKVKIICPTHGVFEQTPNSHLMGFKCPECGSNKKNTTDTFVAKARNRHGDIYDYSLVTYINNSTKVKIICPVHGVFEQTPNYHMTSGKGKCPRCIEYTTDTFIAKAKQVHDRYDYSLVEYKSVASKVKIICPVHGEFKQCANNHLRGYGCPKCGLSKGEESIRKFLETNNIEYEFQKRFADCRNQLPLPFDFYLPKFNICIEFDGLQHFTPYNFGSSKSEEAKLKAFGKIQLNDSIKTQYCSSKNIQLIRIPYTRLESIHNILHTNIVDKY